MRSAVMVASRSVAGKRQVAISRAGRPLASQRADLQAAAIVAAVSEVEHPGTRRRELVLVVLALA